MISKSIKIVFIFCDADFLWDDVGIAPYKVFWTLRRPVHTGSRVLKRFLDKKQESLKALLFEYILFVLILSVHLRGDALKLLEYTYIVAGVGIAKLGGDLRDGLVGGTQKYF